MKILTTGASGFVGSLLIPFLRVSGHEVVCLVRNGPPRANGTLRWNPEAGVTDRDALEGLDAVLHLAGENIAARRWTPRRKELIRSSRVRPTRILSEALAGLQHRPRVLAAASAIGFYGDRGDELLNEQSRPGDGFLAAVSQEWEGATAPAARAGIRVVNLRFGMVLGPTGGALARMLTPFRLGLGGRIGNGRQFMSWISIDDAVEAIHHTLASDTLEGPVNVVAPRPVTNAEFTRTLGRVLSRPAIFPMPAPAARLAFGEMADALLLASTRVEPARLRASGYTFRHPELEPALRHLLGRGGTGAASA